ncbi:hypothetical protein ACF0H5_016665 [Mactra antiquata]
MVYTKEAKERATRLQQKRMSRDPLKVREQGWNSGTTVGRTQTPPRDKQARLNLPVTTNSPPTRDTDRYPRSAPLDDPGQEIVRLQREMEAYLQQIQVIEQRAMKDQGGDQIHVAKSRKKDGYLSDEEDPARSALRKDEQATRSARQIYNLRQQVRALQDQVNRQGSGKIKHTQKSQVMLRLAAAHRGAVRAIQGFVNQQLPQQDLNQGLPAGYQELALLIRQLAVLSTQIRTNKDTENVHEELLKMLDKVDELHNAWQDEIELNKIEQVTEERRRKSPVSRQVIHSAPTSRGRQPSRNVGKENKPKGLLKKQFNKGPKTFKKGAQPRKVTPERQYVLKAGIQALLRENEKPNVGETWNVPIDESGISEPGHTSLILPKGLQHRREKAQRSVAIAMPDTHFSDATLASSLKTKQANEHEEQSREPWRPSGSSHKSPGRSRDRNDTRNQSRERNRSKSPRSSFRDCIVQDMDTELMQELFPEGVDGMGRRGRSTSPKSRSQRQRSMSPPRSQRQRSMSPPRSPGSRSRYTAHALKNKLERLNRGAEDASMINERDKEVTEIQMRQLLDENGPDGINKDMISDMLLNDLVYDTAVELQSLEDDDEIRDRAVTMHHNPTLENIYQRLEQMELEHLDIRRRWGTIQFEEQTKSSVMKTRNIERPSGPVAMEITRRDPSKSHMVQNSRGYNKEEDVPIIFTKSAPVPQYTQHTVLGDTEEDLHNEYPLGLPHRSGKVKLKLPASAVKDIQSNLEKYEHYLKKKSHQAHGRFDPWKLVEEIADQVMTECLKEIEKELEDVEDNLVHQVCKSEFALPESSALSPQEVEEDYGYSEHPEPVNRLEHLRTSQENNNNGNSRHSQREYEESQLRSSQREIEEYEAAVRDSVDKSLVQSSIDTGRSRENGVSSKKEVTFDDREVSYEREDSYEHGAIFDAADLDAALDERDTPRDVYQDDDDDDDDDDEISEVSPIDSDNLEYSTDDA